MPTIKIFRAGKHTAMSGQTLEFTANDLAKTAFTYNNNLARTGFMYNITDHHAPIVLGHPKDNFPIYGWVKSLTSRKDELFADVGKLSTSLVNAVRAGRYKKVSASFLHPDSPENPAKGAWYLKHVGMLGATAPAVKGLGLVSFAEGIDGQSLLIGAAEFAEAGLLAGTPGAFPASQQAIVAFACPDGSSADSDRLRLHQAALRYQYAHRVGYVEAVRAVDK